jgi:hypothetical protein
MLYSGVKRLILLRLKLRFRCLRKTSLTYFIFVWAFFPELQDFDHLWKSFLKSLSVWRTSPWQLNHPVWEIMGMKISHADSCHGRNSNLQLFVSIGKTYSQPSLFNKSVNRHRPEEVIVNIELTCERVCTEWLNPTKYANAYLQKWFGLILSRI